VCCTGTPSQQSKTVTVIVGCEQTKGIRAGPYRYRKTPGQRALRKMPDFSTMSTYPLASGRLICAACN
jgi:hypothetical protein